MIKNLLLLILLGTISVSAQYRFEISGAPSYDVSYEIENCEGDYCSGSLTVDIRKRGAKKVLQQIKLQTEISVDGEPKELNRLDYGKQYAIRFDDYNFDGVRDLAIQNGREGGYGGSSYNIYVFSAKAGKFLFHRPLSALATAPYGSIFEVDRKKKLIRNFSKSGCCMHQTDEFQFIGGRLIKVFSEFSDSFSDAERTKITTTRRVNGRMRTTVKYVRKG